MEVDLLSTELNYGRVGLAKEPTNLNFRAVFKWISADRLELQSLAGDEQQLSIPIAWILDVAAENEDQIVLHHVARDEDEFYIFNHFLSVISFSDNQSRLSILTQLRANVAIARQLRPKRLFVILNPKAGWGKCVQIFDEVALPLLALSNVEIERVAIAPGEDIVEIIAAKDLNGFDGILTAGGDGTHSAIFNGLVKKSTAVNGLELDAENPQIPRFDIAVGILPVGSGNGSSLILNMTHDIQSCVVNIILGNKKRYDIMTVHDESREFKFIAATHLMVGVSGVNAVAQSLEKFRFLGPCRYLIALIFFCLNQDVGYDAVKYKPIQHISSAVCIAEEIDGRMIDCNHCQEILSDTHTNEPGEEWLDLKRLDGVDSGQISLYCQQMYFPVRGITNLSEVTSPNLWHLGNGSVKLILSKSLGLVQFLKFFWCWYENMPSSRIYKEPICIQAVAREAKFELRHPVPLNCDGEIVYQNSKCFYVKAHRGLALAFGTGVVSGHPNIATFNSVWKVRRIMIATLSFAVGAFLAVGYALLFLFSLV